MSRRDARFAVADMVEYLDRALRFVAERERADLDTDLMLEMAVIRALEVLGEAAARADQPTRDLAPEIPWRSIVGMRNMLIHGYDGVDHDVIWRVVTSELGSIREALLQLGALLESISDDA